MALTLSPYEQRQYFDDNGDPLAGGFIATYLSGTSTPATTYSDSTGTENSNPIELDASGRCIIYLDLFAYKFVLTDADGVPVGLPADPVTSTAVGTGSTIGESVFSFGGNSSAAITNTSYPSGSGADTLHPGTAIMSRNSSTLVGDYAIQATGLCAPSGTLTLAIVNISDGAPDTPLATLTLISGTGVLATSGTITFATAGVAKQYGIKSKVSANAGYGWGVSLVRTA